MSKFIEITTEKGKQMININHIIHIADNKITITSHKNFPVECKESYEEIKKKIQHIGGLE